MASATVTCSLKCTAPSRDGAALRAAAADLVQLPLHASSGCLASTGSPSIPKSSSGQACIRGLPITVRRALEGLAAYPDREERRREYPQLEDADIRQALEYAAAALEDRVTELPAA